MKKIIFLLSIVFLFTACSVKVSQGLLSDNLQDINLDGKSFSTYNEIETKITSYYFSTKDNFLHVRDEIVYIPIDATGQLYNPFGKVSPTLYRLTKGKAKTLDEALWMEAEANGFQKLFKNRNEFIIRNEFARDIKYVINEFEKMIDRQDDKNENELIILPF